MQLRLFFLHSVANTQLIDNVAVITGFDTQFFANICHIHLKFLDTAIVHTSPDIPDHAAVSQHPAGMVGQQG